MAQPTETQSEYQVEPLDTARLDDLQRLLEAGFGRRFSRSWLGVKYDTAHAGHGPIGYLAYDRAGEPAGYYGLIPVRMTHAGRTWLAAQSADSVVHPHHRGRGLFFLLLRMSFARARAAGVAVVIAFPNSDPARPFIPSYFQDARRLRGILLPVNRVPFARALARLPGGVPVAAALSRRVLPLLARDAVPRDWSAGWPGLSVERSAAYLEYKARLGNLWVDAAGSPAWIRLRGGQLMVGEILAGDDERTVAALGALRRLARRTGCEAVVWYAPTLPEQLPAAWAVRPLPDWPTHVADVTGELPLDHCELRASDLDSF